MHTPDMTQDNIARIRELFPNCVTEAKDRNGNISLAVDFDALRQELSNSIVEGERERYRLDWPGKKEAMLAANAPIAKTLRPCREESVDFDTTQNLFIEGDNLDALKLLQESYLGKVKMIYIDPPYNTGNDFIYEDDFAENTDAYLERSNQKNESGRLVANPESNGRFHSDWLSMMYPRLKLARSLLADDGVIFISIDDSESDNIKKIGIELFGQKNFISDLTVINNFKGRNDKKYIARANERILMFVKSHNFSENGLKLSQEVINGYNLNDENGKYRLIELRKRGGADTRCDRPNMYYPFYVNKESGNVSLRHDKYFTEQAFPIKSNGVDGRWRWGKEKAKENISFLYGKLVGDKYNIYEKDYLESEEGARRVRPKSVLGGASYSTDVATKEYRNLMGNIDFNNPKPIDLIKDLVVYATSEEESFLILDFFAGSSTTAHAVMQLNAEDGGNRRFIMVQLPEKCDEKSEAAKAGYKTIAEISKERIRRAGKKIKEEMAAKQTSASSTGQGSLLDAAKLVASSLDTGFRVLKVDSSNMADVFYNPDAVSQKTLMEDVSNIKYDRSPEDLLFQVLLDWGVDLSLPIRRVKRQGKTVFFVDENALVACFDKNITEELVQELAKLQPVRAVFRDDGFASDAVKINVEQIFRLLSPGTLVKTL